jgi:uncharacterized protein YndB with AHSA1/START domain
MTTDNTGALKVTTPTDREIVMMRVFEAPRSAVFDALTKPELIKRWMLGPPGWSMPVCEIELEVGCPYRYVWRDNDGVDMGMGGVFREITPPERLVVTEKFDKSWYPGEALVTNTLVEQGGRTTLTLTVLYESREARDAVIKSGMEKGVAASYDRVAELLASKQSSHNTLASDAVSTTEGETKPKRGMFQVISLYLIATFLWRAFTTANEYPSRTLQVMTMALDLIGLIALIGLKVEIGKKIPSNEAKWMAGEVLFWIALIAGLGLFAIRLNGDASWWTGHLTYDIGPHR